MLARELLGVRPGDPQPPVGVDLEAGADPPGRGRGRASLPRPGWSRQDARSRAGLSAAGRPAVRSLLDRYADRSRPGGATRAAISATAASNASRLRALGSRKPLSLRTYWRAAASSSPVVAVSPGRRRVLMLRHIPLRYGACAPTDNTTTARTPGSRDSPWPSSRPRRSPLAVDVVRTGGPGAWLARQRPPAPYAPLGKRVDIGGRSIYLDCRGDGLTDHRARGRDGQRGRWPGARSSTTWRPTTRTCAYDRPGRGLERRPRPAHARRHGRPTCGRALAGAGEPARSSSSATRTAATTPACSAADTATRWLASCCSTRSTRTSRRPGSIRCSGTSGPSTRQRLDGLRALVADVEDLDWPASERQLRDGGPGRRCRSRSCAPRATSRAWMRRRTRRSRPPCIAGYESLSPGSVRYEIGGGRRPHGPDRPAGSRDRRHPPAGRRRAVGSR